ncbi:MAG: hypothetical protein JXQ29_08325 [Planctomycetes bacterium]|nr:hypothetical protein [Planctomycetota bacterium]
MRYLLPIGAWWLAAAIAGAQTMIPLPVYTSTFSVSGATRGFYFQTPVDFMVTGLRVPDEKNHGKQNVAVYKLAAKPPAFSATATGGLLFFKAGEPSAHIIPAQIFFTKGEWFGVLGACGDTTIMHNSYGSAQYPSTVLGQPITLLRFLTQFNLVSTQGTAPYSNEDQGAISRVEVYVQPGAMLVGSGTAKPGTAIVFTLTASSDPGFPYQLASSLGSGPIPFGSRQIGLSPDDLLVLSTTSKLPSVFENYSGRLDAQGVATAKLHIPNFPVLKGVHIYSAYVTLLASAPLGVSSISNTFDFAIL